MSGERERQAAFGVNIAVVKALRLQLVPHKRQPVRLREQVQVEHPAAVTVLLKEVQIFRGYPQLHRAVGLIEFQVKVLGVGCLFRKRFQTARHIRIVRRVKFRGVVQREDAVPLAEQRTGKHIVALSLARLFPCVTQHSVELFAHGHPLADRAVQQRDVAVALIFALPVEQLIRAQQRRGIHLLEPVELSAYDIAAALEIIHEGYAGLVLRGVVLVVGLYLVIARLLADELRYAVAEAAERQQQRKNEAHRPQLEMRGADLYAVEFVVSEHKPKHL